MEYTTGELIQLLENFKTESLADWIVNVDVDVFIEKLQAGDRLCEVAKEAKESQGWDGNNPDDDRWKSLYAKLRKTIAEFEGKS